MSSFGCTFWVGVNGAVATLADDQQIINAILATLRSAPHMVCVLPTASTALPAGLTEPLGALYGKSPSPFH